MKTLTKVLFTAAMLLFINQTFANTQNRPLKGFNAMQLSASYDVYITQSATENVRVDAPGNEMDKIITEVQGGVLKIYSKSEHSLGGWFSGSKKIAIYVNVKDINSIGISGSGDVFFKDGITTSSLKIKVSGSGDVLGKLNVKTLEASISGSGDMKLSGRANNASAVVSGSGDYSARGLATVSTSIRVSGSGDATVNVSSKIDASVSGSGDIRYAGSPTHVLNSSHGSGEIHKI